MSTKPTKFTHVNSVEGYQVAGTSVISSTGTVANSALSAPKVAFIQESFVLADMTDGGGAAATFELSTDIPKGAVVMQSFIDAVTGFAGDTSAVITIGDGTDVDRYNTGTPDVFTTADHISAGAVSGTAYHAAAKTPTITVTAATEWGDVTAGGATITIAYYQSV